MLPEKSKLLQMTKLRSVNPITAKTKMLVLGKYLFSTIVTLRTSNLETVVVVRNIVGGE